mgnify:CR=1 FL=1
MTYTYIIYYISYIIYLVCCMGLPVGTPWWCLFGSGLGWEAHVGCLSTCDSRWGSGGYSGGPWGALGAPVGALCGSLGVLWGLSGGSRVGLGAP